MAEPRIGVIGIPGKWSTETLADAVERRTGSRLVIDMARVELDLGDGRLMFEDQDLCRLDGLMVKKISAEYSPNTLDRLELLRFAESAGVRVFSGAVNMLRLIDRLSCTVTLRNAGIPMPDTIVTKARGMCVIESAWSAGKKLSAVEAFQRDNPMMYIQRRIDLPGRDMGLVFLGGDYLGSYARVSQSESWNTTIHSGGRYDACTPSAEIVELAHRAQAPFGMDFTTVDVAETADGPIVFEVSAFGGFRGALEGAGIDAASAYADYAIARLPS